MAAVLGPAILFAAMAWWSWNRVERETARSIARTVDILHEHAARLFQSDELLLARISDRVEGLSWAEIGERERELHGFLKSLSADVEEVVAAFIADQNGELQAMSRGFPVPARTSPPPTAVNIADRAYFRDARARGGLVVDGPFVGRVSGETIFNVARSLKASDGSFHGVAVLVLSPASLGQFWSGVVAPGDSVSLVRDDGTVLARYPPIPTEVEDRRRRFSETAMTRLRAEARGVFTGIPSPIDGILRTIGHRRLRAEPLHIVYAVDRRNVLREWYPSVVAFGALSAAAMAALFLTALAVIRRSRGESAAVAEAETAAAALRESEARLRTLYDKTPAPMYACDADQRIASVSEHWLRLFGYRREEVIGRKLTEFQPPGAAATFDETIWRPIHEHGEVRDVPRQYVTKAGEVLDVLLSARIERDANGSFVRALGVLVDVTEQNRMAAALQQAKKMEAIGQMTGGLAHDFNNLLTVVLGSIALIADAADKPERVRKMAGRALGAAERGALLTQQLLAFARRQTLRPEVVDLNRVIADFLPLVRQACGERVRIETRLAPELARSLVDQGQFEAALLNLVINARDAMPGGGTVVIETANAELTDADASHQADLKAGPYVRVGVADTGAGKPAEVRQRAFDPFFTTKEVGRGSGLGLSMVYGFTKQSGGHATIASEEGRGTTVALYLPREEPEA